MVDVGQSIGHAMENKSNNAPRLLESGHYSLLLSPTLARAVATQPGLLFIDMMWTFRQ
jgi:hypothetical protein